MANEFIVKNGLVVETGGITNQGDLTITGSLVVSGSDTFINIGPAQLSGSVKITTTDQVQASTDTDKFLVLDGDQVKYRSGTEVRSDISAVASINSETPNGSGDVSLDTDDISEGSSNLYYTDTRVRAAISVNSESPDAGGDIAITTDEVGEGSTNLYYTDGRVKTKLNTEGVLSGSSQVTISDTSGYTSFSSSIASDITSVSSPTLQNVTDNGSSTTDVITFPNFVLNTPTNANAASDKILVLDSANRSKFRTRDNLKSDLNLDSITTPIQLVVDTKALSSGYVSWFGVSDIQQNSNRGYTTWIAPEAGYIERVVISPEQTNTTTANIDLGLYVNGSQQSTDVSVAMGAAGTNKTFTFGSSNYSFSQGERLSLSFDKNTNTADLYNVMVIFRLNS